MTHIPSLDPLAIAERKSWQYRAVAYTHANKSQVGALLVAILGRKCAPPCFHIGGAKIDKAGRIRALYNDGHGYRVRRVYENVEELNNVFRGLAAALEFTDAEREALFQEIRRWIISDERAVSNLDGGVNYRKGRN